LKHRSELRLENLKVDYCSECSYLSHVGSRSLEGISFSAENSFHEFDPRLSREERDEIVRTGDTTLDVFRNDKVILISGWVKFEAK
jgi:hypothetical protein